MTKQAPTMKINNTTSHKCYSPRLMHDSRILLAPRFAKNVYTDASQTAIAKIYAIPEVPGSELLTIELVDHALKTEFEFAFEERYAIPINFKKMSDEEKAATVAGLISTAIFCR